MKVSCSRVVIKYDKQTHFSLFSPTISGKYLFIFYKLEEDNICLIISSPFGWVQLSLNSNPKKEWSVPVCNRTGPLLSNFNESSIGETRRFSFLESLKKLKKTPGFDFFVNLCLPSPKKYKIILERTAWSFTTKEYFSLLVSLIRKSKKATKDTSFYNQYRIWNDKNPAIFLCFYGRKRAVNRPSFNSVLTSLKEKLGNLFMF